MNIFIIILLLFSILGLLDKIRGNQWGYAQDFNKGFATMGTLAMSVIGIYCIGITLVKDHAAVIAEWTRGFPFDPSIIIGSLLAPDLGASYIAPEVSVSPSIGYFSGVIVAACLGQFISFQLPVFFTVLEENDKRHIMRGFLQGIIAIPVGLVTGGVLLGLSLNEIMINTGTISLLCILLAVSFVKAAPVAERVLLTFGSFIGVICLLMFAAVMIGLFIPSWKMADDHLVYEIMIILIRMVVIISGGLVLSNICLRRFRTKLAWIARKLNTNDAAVMGLVMNCISSLAMIPLISKMDAQGKRLNAAFAVSGAYLLGGQLIFVTSLGNHDVTNAFFLSKLAAGIAAIGISKLMDRAALHGS